MINTIGQHKSGWIEVICGSMFSGKTEELIRRLRRAQIARQNVVVFKPKIDDRYDKENIVSHNKQQIKSIVIEKPEEILEHSIFAQVIGIDEAQFFNNDLVDIVQKLADSGKRVIIAGLDKDYRNQPFEPIPQLLAVAEYITKTLAFCVRLYLRGSVRNSLFSCSSAMTRSLRTYSVRERRREESWHRWTRPAEEFRTHVPAGYREDSSRPVLAICLAEGAIGETRLEWRTFFRYWVC